MITFTEYLAVITMIKHSDLMLSVLIIIIAIFVIIGIGKEVQSLDGKGITEYQRQAGP